MNKLTKLVTLRRFKLAPLYSFLIALILGSVIILAIGESPVAIYRMLLKGAFGSRNSILQTLLLATPLLYTGLAVFFGLKGGLLNLGVEGQLYMGALTGTMAAIHLKGLPSLIHVPIILAAGMAGGMVWAFIPIWLKIKRGAHEVVTALMLNYIAMLLMDFLLNYPLREKNSVVPQTVRIQESAKLMRIFANNKLSIAILVGIALAVLLHFLLQRTRLGYEITLVGANPKAAATSGIRVNRIMITTMLISGACAGLAGTMEIIGSYHRLIQGFSSGYGFEGIAVAVLGTTPISVIFSAVIFGALKAGGMMLNFGSNLSVQFITVLQGLIILLIAAPQLVPDLGESIKARWKGRVKS